jgi:hypothetical protein
MSGLSHTLESFRRRESEGSHFPVTLLSKGKVCLQDIFPIHTCKVRDLVMTSMCQI